jgi:hypothetical protein
MLLRLIQLAALSTSAALCAQTAPKPPANLNANFLGNWTGQLEYRDYRTDERVFLPTWLRITETPDRRSIVLSYIYDDGPAKTVRESVTVTLDATGRKVTFAAKDEKFPPGLTSTTFDATGFEDFAKTGRGNLILTGTGNENGKPSAFRITLTLRRNLYTYRKETHPIPAQGAPTEDFQFRDAYLFTRAEPPA